MRCRSCAIPIDEVRDSLCQHCLSPICDDCYKENDGFCGVCRPIGEPKPKGTIFDTRQEEAKDE